MTTKRKAMRGVHAIHHCPTVVLIDWKFVDKVDDRDVRVMATAEGYAMVRRKGCVPYVCHEHDLTYR